MLESIIPTAIKNCALCPRVSEAASNSYKLFDAHINIPAGISHALTQRIGWTLVHFIWQGAALAVILAAILRIMRGSSANMRYVTALAVLAAMVVMPVITFELVQVAPKEHGHATLLAMPPRPWTVVVREMPAREIIPEPVSEQPDTGRVYFKPAADDTAKKMVGILPTLQNFIEPALPYAVVVWFLGVFGLSLWHLGGYAQLQRLRRRMVKDIDLSLRERAAWLAGRLGIKRAIAICESALVQAPVLVGYLRPVILLPASALSGLGVEQLEAIIAHELAHVRRHDYLVNVFQSVIEILGFYHPAVWWVSLRIRAERENCCDDIAVSLCENKAGYVRALAAMEEIRCGALAMSAAGPSLFDRIYRLIGKPARRERTGWLAGTASVLIALAVIGAVLLPLAKAGQGTEKTATTESTESTEKRVIPAEAGIQSSKFLKRLSNGATVELVGVCDYPSKGKEWWRPDGSPLGYKIETYDSSHYTNKDPGYEIAYKVAAPNDVSVGWPRISGSTAKSGLEVLRPAGLQAWRAHISVWGHSTTVSIPIASGPWKTLVETTGRDQTSVNVGSHTLMLGPAEGTAQKFALAVSDDTQDFDHDFRLIAVDKQGKSYISSRNWFSHNDIRQSTFVFTGLDPNSIVRYEFQSRPYEWVEFKNVQLRPKKQPPANSVQGIEKKTATEDSNRQPATGNGPQVSDPNSGAAAPNRPRAGLNPVLAQEQNIVYPKNWAEMAARHKRPAIDANKVSAKPRKAPPAQMVVNKINSAFDVLIRQRGIDFRYQVFMLDPSQNNPDTGVFDYIEEMVDPDLYPYINVRAFGSNKIILGVPFYPDKSAIRSLTADERANLTQRKKTAESTKSDFNAVHKVIDHAEYVFKLGGVELHPYIFNIDPNMPDANSIISFLKKQTDPNLYACVMPNAVEPNQVSVAIPYYSHDSNTAGKGFSLLRTAQAKKSESDVSIAAKFMVVPDQNAVLDIVNTDKAEKVSLPGGPVYLIDDALISGITKAAQRSKQALALEAPKVTVLSGEAANLSITTNNNYIADYSPGKWFSKPKPIYKDFKTGTILNITPIFEPDSNSVLITGRFEINNLVALDQYSSRAGPFFKPQIENIARDFHLDIKTGRSALFTGTQITTSGNKKEHLLVLLTPRPELKNSESNQPAAPLRPQSAGDGQQVNLPARDGNRGVSDSQPAGKSSGRMPYAPQVNSNPLSFLSPKEEMVEFGPVKELMLHNNEYASLFRNKVFSADDPAVQQEFEKSDFPDRLHIATIDIRCTIDQNLSTAELRSCGQMLFIPVDDSYWKSLSKRQLTNIMFRSDASPDIHLSYDSSRMLLGDIYHSRTWYFFEKFSYGLIHISDFNSMNPARVTIEYKFLAKDPISEPNCAPPQETSTQQPATGNQNWGPETAGVSCRLRPEKSQYCEPNVPELTLDIRNRGKSKITYVQLAAEHCDINVDGRWYGWAEPYRIRMHLIELDLSQTRNDDINIDLGNSWALPAEGNEPEFAPGNAKAWGKRLQLAPGRHTVLVRFRPDEWMDSRGPDTKLFGLWAVSNPVEVDITARDANLPKGVTIDTNKPRYATKVAAFDPLSFLSPKKEVIEFGPVKEFALLNGEYASLADAKIYLSSDPVVKKDLAIDIDAQKIDIRCIIDQNDASAELKSCSRVLFQSVDDSCWHSLSKRQLGGIMIRSDAFPYIRLSYDSGAIKSGDFNRSRTWHFFNHNNEGLLHISDFNTMNPAHITIQYKNLLHNPWAEPNSVDKPR